MKYSISGLTLFLLMAMQSVGQVITIPANSIIIKKGAMFSLAGLTFTPTGQDFTFNENVIQTSDTPLPGNPNASIARAYGLYYPITFTGIIEMRYLPSELNGNIETDLQLAFAGGDLKFGIPINSSNVNSNTHVLTEGVTDKTFQFITATSSGSGLPVMLVDFTAISNETSILVAWSTSEEANSDYFEIQHSIDGKQWNKVGEVKANGESSVIKTYAFEHDSPENGDNFYRLKMVDQDGSFAYSRVRNINFNGGSQLTLHPNPVSDWLTINASDWDTFINLKIINMSGAKMGEFDENQLRDLSGKDINVQDFPSGIYIVSITRKDGSVKAEKIFKK